MPGLARPAAAARPALAGRADRPPGAGPLRLGPLRPGLVLRGPALGAGRRTGAGPRPCSTSTTSRTRRSWAAWPCLALRRRRGPARARRTGSDARWPARRSAGGSGCTAGPAGRPRRWWCAATLDAERARDSGVARVAVIPNGYRSVDHPLGRVSVGSPPTRAVPGPPPLPAQHRGGPVAGRRRGHRGWPPGCPTWPSGWSASTAPSCRTWTIRPAVSVVGRVPDMAAELARADLVVVPVRYGSGTRVKILEAFAHRVPVVSTTVGSRGDRRRRRRAPPPRRRRPGPGRGVCPPAHRARPPPDGGRRRPPTVRGAVPLRGGRGGRGPAGRRRGRRGGHGRQPAERARPGAAARPGSSSSSR